jgi:hypothetical protein
MAMQHNYIQCWNALLLPRHTTGIFQLRVFYLLVLQIGVLREDWLFVVGFLASLALLRRVQAPDGAALISAVLISGNTSNQSVA